MPKVFPINLKDCDNTLVLSETLAFEACAELANEILASQGIEDRYTWARPNFRGMMSSLQQKYSLDLPPSTFDSYVTREEDQVIGKIRAALEPCVGVDKELAALGCCWPASVDKVGMDNAATSLEKPTSKPDPAIYLHACKVMGKQPAECVAVEDSKNGTLSAVRAGYEPDKQDEMKAVLKEA
ncbi:HAD-like domain-containing protein, partial [Mycena filopes]